MKSLTLEQAGYLTIEEEVKEKKKKKKIALSRKTEVLTRILNNNKCRLFYETVRHPLTKLRINKPKNISLLLVQLFRYGKEYEKLN